MYMLYIYIYSMWAVVIEDIKGNTTITRDGDQNITQYIGEECVHSPRW